MNYKNADDATTRKVLGAFEQEARAEQERKKTVPRSKVSQKEARFALRQLCVDDPYTGCTAQYIYETLRDFIEQYPDIGYHDVDDLYEDEKPEVTIEDVQAWLESSEGQEALESIAKHAEERKEWERKESGKIK